MTFKISGFKFSFARYWLTLISIAVIIIFLLQRSSADFGHNLKLFIIFGLTGMLGEILVSIWWHYYFDQKFWVYTEATILNKYSSLLNFIPWGIGGLMYFSIIKLVIGSPYINFLRLENLFILIFAASLLIQITIFKLFFNNHKFHKLTTLNFFFLYFPIFLILVILWQIYGNQILWLSLFFGIIATSAEYLFGKFMQLFLTKKLWTYTYATVDHGHFTPLSIPFFTLAGFYFWIIIRIVG